MYNYTNTDGHIVISYADLLPHFYTQVHLNMTIAKRNENDFFSLLALREFSCPSYILNIQSISKDYYSKMSSRFTRNKAILSIQDQRLVYVRVDDTEENLDDAPILFEEGSYN